MGSEEMNADKVNWDVFMRKGQGHSLYVGCMENLTEEEAETQACKLLANMDSIEKNKLTEFYFRWTKGTIPHYLIGKCPWEK
jgi:hypothetical protein